MLNPNARTLYVEALQPPPGYVFDEGLGTTYSLDPATLLTVPLHLLLMGGQQGGGGSLDGVALLESLRRTLDRLSVFCEVGRIHVPRLDTFLYGFLERMLVSCRAPGGGSFHPKLWVLRFKDPEEADQAVLRLLVLSRNLTEDRSWDLALTLDGRVRRQRVRSNFPLAELVARLPGLAVGGADAVHQERATRLAAEVARAEWELPAGFEEVAFHAHGWDDLKTWEPGRSDIAAVISPFLQNNALRLLTNRASKALALVSRPEALAEIDEKVRARFERVLVLNEAAETEDGEDLSADTARSAPDERAVRGPLSGLHAKAYLFQQGWYTRVVMGSANATFAGFGGRNVELLVELSGKSSKVGQLSDLLAEDRFGAILVDFAPEQAAEIDAEAARAEAVLEAARVALATADLRLRCRQANGGDWIVDLSASGPVPLDSIDSLTAWPITLREDHGSADALALRDGSPVALRPCSTARVTGLIGFDATCGEHQARFVLNLPVLGLPEGRTTAILQAVLHNQAGFLRYLRMLLSDLVGDETEGESGEGIAWGALVGPGGEDDDSVLEELVRALWRDPSRLVAIRAVVQDLASTEEGRRLLPERFMEVWERFEPLIAEEGAA